MNCGSSSIEYLRRIAPTAGHPRIIGHLEQRTVGLVVLGELGLAGVGSVDHGAQLEHAERHAVAPDALLGEDHGARRTPLHGDGRDEHQRRRDDQRSDRHGDVEDPLGDGAPPAALGLLDVDQGLPTEVLGSEAGDVDVPEPGRKARRGIRHPSAGG